MPRLTKTWPPLRTKAMGNNVIELEEISLCPNCNARVFEVVETRTSGGPFCRCVECGWENKESNGHG